MNVAGEEAEAVTGEEAEELEQSVVAAETQPERDDLLESQATDPGAKCDSFAFPHQHRIFVAPFE